MSLGGFLMSTQLTTLKDKKGLIRDHVYENLKKILWN